MRRTTAALAALLLVASVPATPPLTAQDTHPAASDSNSGSAPAAEPDSTSDGTENALHLSYTAVEGTLPVGGTDAIDIALAPDGHWLEGKQRYDPDKDPDKAPPVAHMSYTYYALAGNHGDRPITFFYNGGPGSSTIWLHMGAFGPKRVNTADHTPTGAAPYQLEDNPDSLLDVSDLVFIDMPGTGFGTLSGKDPGKAFWGLDEDANAFARFIQRFLTKYNRWNSPKYLFGESYGTTRSAVLSNILENGKNIDLNGVILLSQILNFGTTIDQHTPGNDLPYELALPSFAAVAYYHHKVPSQPASLESFLSEVETYATGDYAHALMQGNALPASEKQAVAEKLHSYTGLPVDYLLKADLRVDGGEFEHALLGDSGMTTGRLDARFSSYSIDPLDKQAQYDPLDPAVDSAYVSLFNQYARDTLKFSADQTFKPTVYAVPNFHWDWKRHGQEDGDPVAAEVLSDLATAMKSDPRLHVLVNGGYFDLGTPFWAAHYEDEHLPVPAALMKNIEFRWYDSGHMVYLHADALHQLHTNVSAFIRATESGSRAPSQP